MTSLRQHIESAHERLKPLKCNDCEISFSEKSGLSRHISEVHLKIKHECEYCKRSFTRKDYLRFHVKAFHQELNLFKCNACNISFSQNSDLRKHLNEVHLKIKP